ncbi:MAG TPA: TetR/AcrR family transcriptional regulator [Caulobacteraceae bacterium]|jgi:AcrR family transcriptional regulator
MAARALTDPRKRASQARSRSTVDALIEATARILVRDGFDRASTNRIAEAAGVSVGSLYQYFPSKEALVAAVIERHNRDLLRIVRRALADAESQPVEQAVRTLVAAAIAAHRIDPKLHRVLAEQTPHLGPAQTVGALDRETYALFRGYLERHRESLRMPDLELATFICATSIEALTHAAVLHRPDMLTDADAETLVEEATRLVVGYLR